MEIENLLGWEHTLQISTYDYFDLNTTQIVIPPLPPFWNITVLWFNTTQIVVTRSPILFEMLLCFGLIPQQL